MDAAVVVDASVWVSWLMPRDVNHNASRLWIERYTTEGGRLLAPAFLLVEAAAAISRRTGQSAVAQEALRNLYYLSAVRILSLNSALVWATVEVAIALQLRAGDATYVALARQLNIPLVSWDREQLQRAADLTATYTPSNYAF